MLSAFSLEDEDFETIRNRAIQSIADYQEDWTNYNIADTGIALLELLAWMQEMQMFYLERNIADREVLYLELLGMKPMQLTPASVLACLSPERTGIIRKNTGFYTGNLRFEPERESLAITADMCNCCVRDKRNRLLWEYRNPSEPFPGTWMFGEYPQKGNCFYLGLDQPFALDCRHSIYLELRMPEDMVRNPVLKPGKNLFFRYCLEYWSMEGWKCCKVLRDETAGFLQSGVIEWISEGEWEEADQCYWLRFRLTACAYDVPPFLAHIDTKRVRLLQKETITASEQCRIQVEGSGHYVVDLEEYFDEPGEILVFLKFDHDYKKLDSWVRIGNRLEIRYQENDDSFLTLMLVTMPRHSKIPVTWEATGFPNQTVNLEDTYIMGSQLRVLVETEYQSGLFHFWNPVSHFWESDKTEECYCFQETTGQLLFGNGEHGGIPEGRIYLTDCVRSLGTEGTIKEGQSFRWKYGTAYNPAAASPGMLPESNRICLNRAVRRMREQSRAVTEADYEALVRQTPGLIIRRVKAVSDLQEDNRVVLVVEGGGKETQGSLHPVYQREIRNWLEQKRLLGTCLVLEAPIYIPVRIRLEAVIHERYHQAEKWIRDAITEYIHIYLEEFGARLNYSHLYGTLDGLNCVAEIKNLTVTALGKGVRSQRDGGFFLPERGLAVLEEINLQLIRRTKE